MNRYYRNFTIIEKYISFIRHIFRYNQLYERVMKTLCFSLYKVFNMKNACLIAEAGCNHMGSVDIAKDIIKTASVFCKVDVVKFQKRNNRELLPPKVYDSPHPNKKNAYGNTYGEHREFLELDIETHRELKEYCEEFGLIYSCSVWDVTSAKEIAGLGPDMIKIPSACNTNMRLLNWLCENYGGEIHLSLGMTTRKEEEEIVNFFCKTQRNKDLILYSCTSAYPVSQEDVCLLEIKRLRETYKNTVNDIGFSGHHKGIFFDIAALALGAKYIERHFTLDKTWKGTDHAASLEPDGMRRLKRGIMSTEIALSVKKDEILGIELAQREKLKTYSSGVPAL